MAISNASATKVPEARVDWNGLDWNGLDWNGLDWNGLDWTGLDWTGLDWTGLDWTGSDWSGRDRCVARRLLCGMHSAHRWYRDSNPFQLSNRK